MILEPLGKIWFLLGRERQIQACWLLCLMIVGMTLEMLGIGLIFPVVGVLVRGDLLNSYPMVGQLLERLGVDNRASLFLFAMLGLVSIYIVKNSFLAVLALRQARFIYGLQAELSERLFSKYLRQSYTFHLQRNSAQLILNVSNGILMLTSSALSPIMLLLSETLVFIGFCCLLFVVEPLGTIMVISMLGFAAWIFSRFTRSRIAIWGRARQHHEGMRIQHVQQGLGGIKEIKILGREREFIARFRTHSDAVARATQSQVVLQQMPRLWIELLGVTGLCIVVIAMISQNKNLGMIVPTIGLFGAAAFRLMPSANRMISSVQQLRYGVPVVETLHEEMFPAEVNSKIPGVNLQHSLQQDIRLSGVAYQYPAASLPALADISLCIKCGESVGFVGASGSGKSTLIDVILGLLPPQAGEVSVDGQDISTCLFAWQARIGYVPQTIYLTDDSLRKNIAFGIPESEIDDAAIQRTVKAAQLEELVSELPEGVNTVVGERGSRLSGGQRQRIGIARALYHDPDVLVLDEATSALDPVTEQGVMSAVVALKGKKTILIVAHRLSTVEHCDRLYTIERGRIVEVENQTSAPAA